MYVYTAFTKHMILFQVKLKQSNLQSVHQQYEEILRGVREKANYASQQLVSASHKADQSIKWVNPIDFHKGHPLPFQLPTCIMLIIILLTSIQRKTSFQRTKSQSILYYMHVTLTAVTGLHLELVHVSFLVSLCLLFSLYLSSCTLQRTSQWCGHTEECCRGVTVYW